MGKQHRTARERKRERKALLEREGWESLGWCLVDWRGLLIGTMAPKCASKGNYITDSSYSTMPNTKAFPAIACNMFSPL